MINIHHNDQNIAIGHLCEACEAYDLNDGDYFLWMNDLWIIKSHDPEIWLSTFRIGYFYRDRNMIELGKFYKEFQQNDNNFDKFNGYAWVEKLIVTKIDRL